MSRENGRGVLFVFSGPSGVGKGTLKAMFLKEFEGQVAYSVSATTRETRAGEVHGRDYFFISRQEFEARAENHEFLEHAEYAGNLYGTPRAYVEQFLARGVSVLLEIEVQGALQVMEKVPDCVSVFILPPSLEELERRLRSRATEEEAVIVERLNTARQELKLAPRYDYRIVNDELQEAYAQLRAVFLKETGAAGAGAVPV